VEYYDNSILLGRDIINEIELSIYDNQIDDIYEEYFTIGSNYDVTTGFYISFNETSDTFDYITWLSYSMLDYQVTYTTTENIGWTDVVSLTGGMLSLIRSILIVIITLVLYGCAVGPLKWEGYAVYEPLSKEITKRLETFIEEKIHNGELQKGPNYGNKNIL